MPPWATPAAVPIAGNPVGGRTRRRWLICQIGCLACSTTESRSSLRGRLLGTSSLKDSATPRWHRSLGGCGEEAWTRKKSLPSCVRSTALVCPAVSRRGGGGDRGEHQPLPAGAERREVQAHRLWQCRAACRSPRPRSPLRSGLGLAGLGWSALAARSGRRGDAADERNGAGDMGGAARDRGSRRAGSLLPLPAPLEDCFAARAALELAESESAVVVSARALDADPWLLTVENGTVDLRTGELREHRRDD